MEKLTTEQQINLKRQAIKQLTGCIDDWNRRAVSAAADIAQLEKEIENLENELPKNA